MRSSARKRQASLQRRCERRPRNRRSVCVRAVHRAGADARARRRRSESSRMNTTSGLITAATVSFAVRPRLIEPDTLAGVELPEACAARPRQRVGEMPGRRVEMAGRGDQRSSRSPRLSASRTAARLRAAPRRAADLELLPDPLSIVGRQPLEQHGEVGRMQRLTRACSSVRVCRCCSCRGDRASGLPAVGERRQEAMLLEHRVTFLERLIESAVRRGEARPVQIRQAVRHLAHSAFASRPFCARCFTHTGPTRASRLEQRGRCARRQRDSALAPRRAESATAIEVLGFARGRDGGRPSSACPLP